MHNLYILDPEKCPNYVFNIYWCMTSIYFKRTLLRILDKHSFSYNGNICCYNYLCYLSYLYPIVFLSHCNSNPKCIFSWNSVLNHNVLYSSSVKVFFKFRMQKKTQSITKNQYTSNHIENNCNKEFKRFNSSHLWIYL